MSDSSSASTDSSANRFPSWPANEVESLLHRAAKEMDARPAFIRALLETTLYVIPLPESQYEVKDGQVQPGGKVALLHVQTEGKQAIAAFTSLETHQASCRPNTPSLGFSTRDLFAMTRGAHIAVNPVGPTGKLFLPEEIDELLSGLISSGDGSTREAVAGSRYMLGSPKTPPANLVRELSEAFAKEPGVKAAHLGVIAFEKSTAPPHPIVGIEFEGDFRALLTRLRPILERGSAEVQGAIDVVPLNGSSMGDSLRTSTQAFYTRA